MHGIYKKALPFPAEIMVVNDGRHTGFCQEFRNGHTKGNIHRNGQGIFRDEHVNPKFITKFSELGFQIIFQFLNMFGSLLKLFPDIPYPDGHRHPPDCIKHKYKNWCQCTKAHSHHPLVCFIGKYDKELYNRRAKAQKKASLCDAISKKRQKEKQAPYPTPDDARIEPSGRQRWRKIYT